MKIFRNIVVIILFSISTIAISDSNDPPGVIWQSWSDHSRDIYISGFNDGASRVFLKASEEWLPQESLFVKPVPPHISAVAKMFLIDRSIIRDITTKLYEDPANVYIPIGDMFYLSREKLEGYDINMRLIEERKKAKKEREILKRYPLQ